MEAGEVAPPASTPRSPSPLLYDRRVIRVSPIRLAKALLAACLALPSFALAGPQPPTGGVGGALVAFGPESWPADKLGRRGASALFLAGAGQFAADEILPWTDLAGEEPVWVGPAPMASCPAGAAPLAASDLPARLDEVASDLLFGRLQPARESLAQIASALPCLDGFAAQADLFRLWFLRGALEYMEGRPSEARLELSRAAIVDSEAAFDETFPPALHDLLVRAKEEVLRRPRASAAVLLPGGEIRLDGRPATLADGRAEIRLAQGPHLVQARVGGTTMTRVVTLEGLSVQEGVTILGLADRAGLSSALADLLGEGGPGSQGGALAASFVHAWLAQRGLPWALLVDAGARPGLEPRVVQVQALAAGASPYLARPARGDRFTSRARLALSVGYRGQQPERGSGRRPGSYLAWSLGLWLPVSWVARTGFTVGMSHTSVQVEDPSAGEDASCCLLPEVGFRVRGEWPTGWGRPYLEGAFVVLWPFVDLTRTQSQAERRAVWGPEGWLGLLLTPGRHRRVGIDFAAGAGTATEIGGWIRFRAGAELRF